MGYTISVSEKYFRSFLFHLFHSSFLHPDRPTTLILVSHRARQLTHSPPRNRQAPLMSVCVSCHRLSLDAQSVLKISTGAIGVRSSDNAIVMALAMEDNT